jgi:hypothetical protein
MKAYKIVIKNEKKIQGIYYREFETPQKANEWADERTNTVAKTYGKASFNLSECDLKEFLFNTQF